MDPEAKDVISDQKQGGLCRVLQAGGVKMVFGSPLIRTCRCRYQSSQNHMNHMTFFMTSSGYTDWLNKRNLFREILICELPWLKCVIRMGTCLSVVCVSFFFMPLYTNMKLDCMCLLCKVMGWVDSAEGLFLYHGWNSTPAASLLTVHWSSARLSLYPQHPTPPSVCASVRFRHRFHANRHHKLKP